ncbi:MAG: carboxylesterase/lipase family protein [Gammaproteobacteria bacterium]
MKRSIALALPSLCAAVALQVPAHAAAPSHPRVKVAGGTLEGRVEEGGVRAFKGIPFAAAPVGSLRWQAPQAAPAWKGVRTADAFGPRCMQRALFSDMVFRSNGVSEDCLYLNVWTPAKKAGAKLPVLVYFYGGGLVAGDGSEPRYDGANMARQGVVAITVNYRLGVFGFLAHPELTAESPHKASGNYGFMDQAAALHWVRQNIAAFGGDPQRVTIAGESAGSFSVSVQMVSPLARKVIAGGIGESGAAMGRDPLPTLEEAHAAGQCFAEQVGASNLAALRALPAATLLEATARPDTPRLSMVVDGYVLPQAPAALYASGQQAKVPLLAGWNSAEGTAQAILGEGGATEENFKAALQKLYGDQADAARQAYSGDIEQAARELASDRFIGFGTWRWIDLHAKTSGQPVYRYYYTRPRPASVDGKPAATGAGHSVEIEYVMGNLDGNKVYAWTPEDRTVSRLSQAYFVNFIKTGNPNGKGLPSWPAVGAQGAGAGSGVMLLDVQPKAIEASDAAHHAFHQQLSKE